MPWTGCKRASAPGKLEWTDWTRTCAGRESKMSDATPVAGADQEILITRILDAPRQRRLAGRPSIQRQTAPSESARRLERHSDDLL